MQENRIPDKQIKIPAKTHKEVKLLSVEEGREMREIMQTAFEYYMKNRNKK